MWVCDTERKHRHARRHTATHFVSNVIFFPSVLSCVCVLRVSVSVYRVTVWVCRWETRQRQTRGAPVCACTVLHCMPMHSSFYVSNVLYKEIFPIGSVRQEPLKMAIHYNTKTRVKILIAVKREISEKNLQKKFVVVAIAAASQQWQEKSQSKSEQNLFYTQKSQKKRKTDGATWAK